MNEELRIIISAEIDKLQKALEKGQEELKKTEKTGKSTGNGLGKALGSAGKIVGTAMKAMVTAVAAAGAAMVGLTESTREYRTQQAMLATSFQTSGGSAETAKEVYEDLYRVLGDTGQATEAAQHLSQLTTEQQALSEWTTICQGVYATFGESLPIESLTEAANETAKTGELTGALADALNWAGVNEEEFKDQLFLCNTEAEREALIRETLTGLYGDAAEQYEKTAADILKANEAQLALTDATAQAGAALEPVVTTLKVGLAGALQGLMPHFATFSEGFNDTVSGVEGGADKMTAGIEGLIDSALETITDSLPMFLSIGLDIVVALLEGIAAMLPDLVAVAGDIISELVDTLVTLIPLLTEAILNALPMLIDLVFQIAEEVLVALGEILPDILAQVVEILPQIVESITSNIPTLLQAAIDFLMAIVDAIPEIIPALVEALPQIVESIISCLIESIPTLLKGAIELFTALILAIPEIIPDLIIALGDIVLAVFEALGLALPEAFTSIWGDVKKVFADPGAFFKEKFDGARAKVESAFSSVGSWFGSRWTDIKGAFKDTGSWFKSSFDTAYTNATNAFKNAKTGFSNVWKNIKDGFGNVSDWFKNTFTTAWTNVKNVFSTGGKIFDGIKDGILDGLKSIINGIIDGINKVIKVPFDGINTALGKIKNIEIVGIKPFDWITTISVPQIPKLYRGGVLEKGQVGLLEGSGAEAVVPLENNDAWLTKIAEKLHGLMDDGSGREIVLQVDGKTFARTSIKSINQLTKQTGKLDLVLA